MIEDILVGLLGGVAASRFLKAFRPRQRSEFDQMPSELLKERNGWIETAGSWVYLASFVLLFILVANVGLKSDFWVWRIGLLFFFPVTLFLGFIIIATLPEGGHRLREFWRFHELKHGARLGIMLAGYISFAITGLISLVLVVGDMFALL